jgi:hypothetical protein
MGPNDRREWVSFCNNDGANDVWIQVGRDAEADHGILVKAGGGSTILDMVNTPWFDEINAIAITAAVDLAVTEVEWYK